MYDFIELKKSEFEYELRCYQANTIIIPTNCIISLQTIESDIDIKYAKVLYLM